MGTPTDGRGGKRVAEKEEEEKEEEADKAFSRRRKTEKERRQKDDTSFMPTFMPTLAICYNLPYCKPKREASCWVIGKEYELAPSLPPRYEDVFILRGRFKPYLTQR